jgi:hypothetical protein
MEPPASIIAALVGASFALIPIAMLVLPTIIRPKVRVPFSDVRMSPHCPESPKAIHAALEDFMEEWSSRFGPDPKTREALKGLDIYWIPKPAFYARGIKAAGVVDNRNRIRIAAPPGIHLGQTAFFHELVHLMLWHTQGDPDPDHEGDAWAGWNPEHSELIEELNKRWREGSPEFPLPTWKMAGPAAELDQNRCASCR